MLGLQVVCHKDRSLQIMWGGDCTEWLSPARLQQYTMTSFIARISDGVQEEVEVAVTAVPNRLP